MQTYHVTNVVMIHAMWQGGILISIQKLGGQHNPVLRKGVYKMGVLVRPQNFENYVHFPVKIVTYFKVHLLLWQ